MGVKKTHEEFVAEMRTKHPDIEVVGEYVGANTKLLVQHTCGHQWSVRPSSLLLGHGCRKCAVEAITRDHDSFVVELAKVSPDITVLGEYVRNRTKLQVQHKCGHQWSTLPRDLLLGHGCSKCSGNEKKMHEQFVDELAKVSPDITVLGEYVRNSTKLQVQHKCSHRWDVTPKNLLRGSNCPKCAVEARRKTHEQFLAELVKVSPDITVLGKYVSSSTKLQVQHKCGHQWSVIPDNLLCGDGCPKCAVEARKKTHEQFVAELAKVNHEITVLGEYVGYNTKLQVQHKCGHRWGVIPSGILRGCGCPKCAKSGYDSSKRAYFYSYHFAGYFGFGITNTPTVRHNQHIRTFNKLGIEATLMQTFSGDGKAIQDFETHLKRTLPIVNTGVEGFKTEAILWGDRELLFKACEEFQRNQSLKT